METGEGREQVGGEVSPSGEGARMQGAEGGFRAPHMCSKEGKSHRTHPVEWAKVSDDSKRFPGSFLARAVERQCLYLRSNQSHTLWPFQAAPETWGHTRPSPVSGPRESGQAWKGQAGVPNRVEGQGADGAGLHTGEAGPTYPDLSLSAGRQGRTADGHTPRHWPRSAEASPSP